MDIYNWDMVCAVSCHELNKNLKKVSPTFFDEFRWSDSEGNEIVGTFSGWEIVPGGDSQRINIIMPISYGTLSIPKMNKDHITVDGLCPKIQVELVFISSEEKGEDSHLKFNLKQVSKNGMDVKAGGGNVVVLDADINHLFPGSDAIIADLYCAMMVEMLVSMQEKIKYIFTNIMSISECNSTSWMTPIMFSYAYNEKINGQLGCLAVLAVLDHSNDDDFVPVHPAVERQLIFDSSLVRDGGTIGFMLSQHMFMKHVVLRGLADVFKGSVSGQYFLDSDNVIRNNGNISLDKLEGYTPYFNSLELKIIDNKIVINNASGYCSVGADRSYNSFALAASYSARLSVSEGHNSVVLNSDNGPSLNIEINDELAKFLWLFGGRRVDELLHRIKDEMSELLFEFSSKMTFDIYPIIFNVENKYSECGIAEHFFMRD